jgi:hypothetical protein
VPPEFKPSRESLTPAERLELTLRYVRRAADFIEAQQAEEGELPAFALGELNKAAVSLGMAVNYCKSRRRP